MDIHLWRDISVVLLAVEAFVLAIVPLAILFVANKGLQRLRGSLRPVLPAIRARVQQVEVVTARAGELIVAPIIATYAFAARLRRVGQRVVGLPREDVRR
jgi:hypothetical protein